jgi:hypothetical protein
MKINAMNKNKDAFMLLNLLHGRCEVILINYRH